MAAVRPGSEYDVVALVFTWAPLRKIRYPVTLTLSVEAVQERLICPEDTAVAVKTVGAAGGCMSVVALAVFEFAEVPPLLVARTRK